MSLATSDFLAAAAALGCDVAAIRAIDEVESRGAGFDAGGRVKILFEPHRFSLHTSARFDRSHPQLSYPKWKAGSSSYRRDQHKVLEEARALDAAAAVRATSWGRYQILGDNWRATGHHSLQAFEAAMRKNEGEHLTAFVSFVRAHPAMRSALVAHQWAAFARAYNGPAFATHGYDTRLAAAHRKYGGK